MERQKKKRTKMAGYSVILDELFNRLQYQKSAMREVIDAFFELVEEHLLRGEIVKLPIGTFKIVEKHERIGVHPKTGERIKIPARKTVKYKPSKKIKEMLNT